jgi:ABC-type dipeptide/oligopeptide/nickel transport system permease component
LLTFLIRRLFAIVPVGIGVVAIVSMLIHIVPGDPADAILRSDSATQEEKNEVRRQLGLDRPFHVQLADYYKKIAVGDLGESYIYRKPVATLIGERVQATMELACVAMLIAITLSIPLGVTSALNQGKPIDYAAMAFALGGVAIPGFWLGPMLILLFSLQLGWLPVSERGDWQTYVLPAVTLGTALAAFLSRMTRTSMLENMKEDYVRTARAKGNSEAIVIGKHVFRNAALPLVTVVGLQFGVLLTGAIITERVFDWPGLGTLILDGINNRDYPLVQGCVLVFSASYLIVNLLTDMAYALVDPRIKVERG